MKGRPVHGAALCLTMCLPVHADGQAPAPATGIVAAADSAVTVFLASARAATERFRDQAVAVRAGFKRLGPDFPGMGEHWINAARIFESSTDATRPAMLSYATIDGVPTLVGVVYARALVAEEQPPDWPVGSEAWHDHTLSVEEESLARTHEAHGTDGTAPPRLALLHAWVWLDNPAGPFASDNWSLPFARLGIATAGDVVVTAAKAASLLTGGDRHILWAVDRSARPDSAERATIAERVETFRQQVMRLLVARDAGALRETEMITLTRAWVEMCDGLTRAVSTVTASRLREVVCAER